MKALALLLAPAVVIAVAAACGGDEAAPEPATTVAGFEFTGGDVAAGEPIDARYTCDGDDVSPELSWGGVPDGTAELALVVEDPDAGGFTHWLVYGMRPNATRLPPRVQPAPRISGPTPLLQGENDFDDIGYGGPCPPEGSTHDYVFRLLALDAELGLEPGATRGDLDEAAAGHLIAETSLQAPYERPG